MRNRIRYYLIRLANFIGDDNHYDLGDEIVAMREHKKKLIIATKQNMWSYDGKKYKKLI